MLELILTIPFLHSIYPCFPLQNNSCTTVAQQFHNSCTTVAQQLHNSCTTPCFPSKTTVAQQLQQTVAQQLYNSGGGGFGGEAIEGVR